jgi:hypothetical protein
MPALKSRFGVNNELLQMLKISYQQKVMSASSTKRGKIVVA